MFSRPGQAVATSSNFALMSLTCSARSSAPGRPYYSRWCFRSSERKAHNGTIANILRTFVTTFTMTFAHESCTSPAFLSSVMSVRSSRRSWYWMCQMWNPMMKRMGPFPSLKMRMDLSPRGGGQRCSGNFISADCFRWCCRTPKRGCSSRHSRRFRRRSDITCQNPRIWLIRKSLSVRRCHRAYTCFRTHNGFLTSSRHPKSSVQREPSILRKGECQPDFPGQVIG